jgi:insulysin
VITPGENVVDAGLINGVNAAFVRDYLLADDSPATRAAALVAANFFSEPFFTELRTKQQLGYIVGSSGTSSLRQRYFTFIVQSSGYAPDELQRRAETFIATLPAALAALPDEKWATLIAGARSILEEKPKSISEKAALFFANAFTYDGEWDRRQAALAALDTLTKEQAVALLTAALDPEKSRRRTILLHSDKHMPAETITPTFTDRNVWKNTRQFN